MMRSRKNTTFVLGATAGRLIGTCLLFLVVAILITSAPTAAISQDQQDVFSEGIYYYDTEVSSTCGSTSGVTGGGEVNFLAQWELEESGGGGGEYNPYNYTSGPGTDYNSVGVKNYPDYQTGIQETVVFFQQSNMKAFLAALESGDVQATASALDAFYGSWGGPAMGSKIVSDMSNVNLKQTIPSMPGHSIGDFAQDLLSALSSSSAATTDSTSDGCGAVAGNLVQTAINLAWNDIAHPRDSVDTPACYSDGNAITPESSSCHHGFQQRSGNGATTNGDPTQYTTQSYQSAVSQYNSSVDSTDFTDCGVFIATVMHASGVDPNYPGSGTSTQLSYVESHPDKYQIINNVTDASQLQPGDIFINSEHTWMYVGQQSDGWSVAEASQFNHSPEIDANAYPSGFTLVRVKG